MTALSRWSGYVLCLVIFCSGCISVERSYPDKRYFVIEMGEVPKAPKTLSAGDHGVLLVSDLHISPRYAGTEFVYRTSETRYESDFYNQFLSPPATMISEELRKGLAEGTVFKYVIGPSNELTANYVLEGSINALYGDFRSLNAPAAVLGIEVFLRSQDPAKPGILLHKSYRKSVAIDQRTPEALTKGWNQALQQTVAMLLADLKKAEL